MTKKSPKKQLKRSPPVKEHSPTYRWVPKNQVHKMSNGNAYVCKQHLTVTATYSPEIPSRLPTQHFWQLKDKDTAHSRIANTQVSHTLKQLQMCLRAFELQKKLFGVSSVLIPQQSWKEFVRKQQGYKPFPHVPFKEALRRQQGYRRLPGTIKVTTS